MSQNNEIIKNDITNEKFMNVVYQTSYFLKYFKELDNADQIKAYQSLKKISETLAGSNSHSERQFASDCAYKTDKILEYAGLKRQDNISCSISSDEHHIIRMDFYGSVDQRRDHQLSALYKKLRKKKLSKPLPLRQYNLDSAPMWALFRQFDSFRKIENSLRAYLAKNRYPTEILKIMSIQDFSDLIHSTFKEKDDQLKVTFVRGDSKRNAFVKDMAFKHEKEIRQILSDYDPRYVNSLLLAMQSYGYTSLRNLHILEDYFTQEILNNIKKLHIECPDYKLGEKISADFKEFVIDNNLGYFFAARDQNGEILDRTKFPSFEVHHKLAVTESEQLPCISLSNYRSNFLLVTSEMHALVLHGDDHKVTVNGKQAYFGRMECEDRDLAFMAGFSADTHISHNWRKSKLYQKMINEDRKYLVSYEDCARELQKNITRYLYEEKKQEALDLDAVVQSVKETLRKKKSKKKENKKKKKNSKNIQQQNPKKSFKKNEDILKNFALIKMNKGGRR